MLNAQLRFFAQGNPRANVAYRGLSAGLTIVFFFTCDCGYTRLTLTLPLPSDNAIVNTTIVYAHTSDIFSFQIQKSPFWRFFPEIPRST